MKRTFRRTAVALLACLLALLCVLEGIVLAGSRSSRDQQADVVLILGAMVYTSGPSQVLQLRMETGLHYLREHPDAVAVVSGGQGGNEPASEAGTMADFLHASGVPPERILQEDRSRNTYENLRNSAALLAGQGYDLETARVLVVTSGFHLARARLLAKRCGLKQVRTLAAPMPDSWSNTVYCYGREALALVKSVLFDRAAPAKAFCPTFSRKSWQGGSCLFKEENCFRTQEDRPNCRVIRPQGTLARGFLYPNCGSHHLDTTSQTQRGAQICMKNSDNWNNATAPCRPN